MVNWGGGSWQLTDPVCVVLQDEAQMPLFSFFLLASFCPCLGCVLDVHFWRPTWCPAVHWQDPVARYPDPDSPQRSNDHWPKDCPHSSGNIFAFMLPTVPCPPTLLLVAALHCPLPALCPNSCSVWADLHSASTRLRLCNATTKGLMHLVVSHWLVKFVLCCWLFGLIEYCFVHSHGLFWHPEVQWKCDATMERYLWNLNCLHFNSVFGLSTH